MPLTVHTLGPFKVMRAGERVTNFATDKVRALLAYLVLSPDHPHRREMLAGLLWPEYPEHSARTNLRNALANLRSVICDNAASPSFLYSTRQTIQFNAQSDYWLDADAFEDLLTLQPTMGVNLEQAVSLVRGPFLEGFSLADAAPFEEWLLLRREHYGRRLVEALDRLIAIQEGQGALDSALVYARRRVALEPWQEEGQRQLMRLLMRSGRRSEAIALYQSHRQELAAELSVEPAPETIQLFEQIRSGELEQATLPPGPGWHVETPAQLPRFLEEEKDAVKPPLFVAREEELAQLRGHLDDALAGRGHLLFVTGGPGRGKTALLGEFGRQAMNAHPNLLAVSGNCNAFSGIGDPYLPFREMMSTLTGDVEGRWLAGALTTGQASRLWNALPFVIQMLLQHGPHVTGPLVAGQPLLSRAALWCGSASAGAQSVTWLHRLRRRVEHGLADHDRTEQSHLFQQVTNLLRGVAQKYPLLLIIDDLQWADAASISLLFHLGRRLEGTRILLAGAYRAEEVALGHKGTMDWEGNDASSERSGQRPLSGILSEFKRIYGDVWIDLAETGQSEQRHFVDAFLDSEPNRLGEAFRSELTRRAGGHPLFTVELVSAMQARGDLVCDGEGFWTEGAVLDWGKLPLRVQGAIEARVERLEPELRKILDVASVAGEDLIVPVVAQVRGMTEEALQSRLARDLARRHRLVVEKGHLQSGQKRLSRFKFSHALVQNYLYQRLSWGERRQLHGEVAAAIENCFGDGADSLAVQLAQHYHSAGDDGRALHYYSRAAENAQRVYADAEAYAHYTRAIEAARRVAADNDTLIMLFLERGQVCHKLDRFEEALTDYEAALELVRRADENARAYRVWRVLINMGRLWSSRDYQRAHDCFRDALELAQRMDNPKLLAESLNWMGNWYLNQTKPQAAVARHQEALAIFEQTGSRRDLAVTLDLLGISALIGGDITACVEYYDRAIALFRELNDQPNLASSLTGRGHTGCSTYSSLTLVPSAVPTNSRQDFTEAGRITRQIGSSAGEIWVQWSLATLEMVQGRYGQALKVLQRGLDMATQIEHLEWIVGTHSVLGMLYLELLAPDPARQHLEVALRQAAALGSQVWLHQAAGSLAKAYCLLDDKIQALSIFEEVLSPDTPMDTINKRYCWARRAELALCEGGTALALDIVERLIASALGMGPNGVIAFLWKLKGEALAAQGELEAAHSLVSVATENARSTGQRFMLWRLHATLGQLYELMGRQRAAAEEFANADRLIEELAHSLPQGKLKENFLRRARERPKVLT